MAQIVVQVFIEILERDLNRLNEEIRLLENEKDLWSVRGKVNNSIGTLAVHLCGSLQHFIGSVIGKTAYVRDRNLEFGIRNVPSSKIISDIEETMIMLKDVLGGLSDADMENEFPIELLGKKRSFGFVLAQMCAHVNYHLGQVNYYRRTISE